MLKQIITASVLALTLPAMAQGSDTAEAGAKILAPLTVTNTAPLYFGTIVPDLAAEGTVEVSGTSSTNKTCTIVTCVTSDETLAAFTITGPRRAVVRTTRPADITIANANGDTMTVKDFTDGNGPNWSGATPLGPQGSRDIKVGATLVVAPNQPEGDYVGTFILTVEYN